MVIHTSTEFCNETGKLVYRTKKKAVKAAARYAGLAAKEGRAFGRYVYECPFCGFYHLTKQDQKR